MLLSSKLPILQKARLLKVGQIQPLSKYHRLCVSLIAPHGFTDLWMFPFKDWTINYGTAGALIAFQPKSIQFIILYLFSLIHLKNDISVPFPFQLLYSLGVHLSWVCFPEWALSYLAWIHTSSHYIRVIPFLTNIQIFSLVMTHILVYILIQKYEPQDLSFNRVWIPIVIGHIMTNC